MKIQNIKFFTLCFVFFACNKFFAMSSERTKLINELTEAFKSQTEMDGKVEVNYYACFDKITKRSNTNGWSDYSSLEIDSKELEKMSTKKLNAVLSEFKFNKNYPVAYLAKQCFENCFKSKQS